MSSPADAGRRYGGLTADERRAARREQLIDAGLELFGTVGFAGTSIRAVLRESGLAERYFYESFDSLEALLVAVHERVHEQLVTAVRAATDAAGDDVVARTRAGLEAFVGTLSTDNRLIKLKLQELSGTAGEELRRFRQYAFARYAQLLVDFGPLEAAKARGLDPSALAIGVLAAIEALLDSWVAGELATDLDGLIDHAVVIVAGTVDRISAP
ncbi:MAG: TetR/AcrR family transcriptional regulator [Solirubrobacteraceae bacterium]|nr:TetR/AcrR family transcriptional regulator [Solirubrobacteraceae bacterium]